ncbi:hypothetical protein [Streptomyces sp. NPDC055642]
MFSIQEVLGVADQVASVLSCLLSVASLRVSLAALRTNGGEATVRPARHRYVPWLALLLAVTAMAAVIAALVPSSFGLPAPFDLAPAGASATMSLFLATVWLRRRQRDRSVLPDDVVQLLEAVRQDARRHRYVFHDGHVPNLSTVYVEQRGESVAEGEAEGAHAGRVLTIADMVTRSRHAIVVAGPGAGKSTMLAQLAGTLAHHWLDAPMRRRGRSPFGAVVAVVIPAAALQHADLPDALVTTCAEVYGVELDRRRFATPPAPGASWMVLVDGIDEIIDRTSRSEVLWRLSASLSQSDGCRLVLTSRPLPTGEIADLRHPGVAEYRLRIFDQNGLREFSGSGSEHALDDCVALLTHVSSWPVSPEPGCPQWFAYHCLRPSRLWCSSRIENGHCLPPAPACMNDLSTTFSPVAAAVRHDTLLCVPH